MPADASVAQLQDLLLLTFSWMEQEGGWALYLMPKVVQHLFQCASSGQPVSLPVRFAFGLVAQPQIDAMCSAIRDGVVTLEQLHEIVYDRVAIESLLRGRRQYEAELAFPISDVYGSPPPDGGYPIPPMQEQITTTVANVEFQMLSPHMGDLIHCTVIEHTLSEWLRLTLSPKSIVYDVGANIGLYTVAALKLNAARVYSFEPSPLNAACMITNLHLNGLSAEHVYPVALAERSGLTQFGLSSLESGAWAHPGVGNSDGVAIGCYTMTLDDFVEHSPDGVPTHIKIDVDGQELSVLRGAQGVLGHESTRHVLVETTGDLFEQVVDLMGTHGFELTSVPILQFGNCVFEKRK